MAHTTEGSTASVEAVRFSFLTDEEVKKHSCVKVTNPTLLDSVERPVPGGLYDPAMGPVEDRTLCKSCGQRSFHCPGHCGHIDLISPVYNPLLFNILHNLLQRTCFYCHHFRASRSQVKTCVSQLQLIIEGDIAGAKRLDSVSPSESLSTEESDGSHVSCSTVHSGAQCHGSKHLKRHEWTSLQFTEAMSVLNNFLKPKYKECKNCSGKNPTISKPTFGWFYMSVMSAHTRANVIRGCNLEGPLTGGAEGITSSEVEKTNDAVCGGSDVDATETHSSSAASPGAQDTAEKGHGGRRGKVPREFSKQKNVFSGPLLPSEVKDIVKLLWENEAQLCSFISDIQQLGFGEKVGHSMFCLDTILVPPIKFRPPSKGGDSVMEHPQTVLLGKVLLSNISLRDAIDNKLERSKIVSRWMELQQSVNVLYDSKTATGQGQRNVAPGICQLLEKKEGMFRQKMMGKRVNYACRSVISPDPYLAVNEIGIPPYFALRLTYPERVTPWNVVKLRAAIINGPEVHPGATHYVDKLSTKILPPVRKGRISISRKLPSSRGVVAQPGKICDYDFEGKIVYRHLEDGDIVLVNRQPTLHKPSIMAHVVRVLKGEKTLRMHYANCSTYNADFDGDEMNVHFPQDEISRAEAYNIVNANNQYVVPSRGEPIRALIQDHIVSAVLLTKKDTFLRWDEFNQLLYSSGVSAAGPGSFSGKPGQKVFISDSEDEMQSLLPAIWKPEPLWTGKQVITAMLNHITRGCPPLTVMKDGKLPPDFFRTKSDGDKSSEKKNNEGKLSQDKENDEDNKLSKEKDADKGKRGKEKGSDKGKPKKEKGADKSKLSKEKGADKVEMSEEKNVADDDEARKEKKAGEGKSKKKEEPGENKLLIYRNDLVRGVIDKAQFGDYGLIHTVQELYGSNTAGILLSVLSRLFTVFLQMHGFTCGVDDLLIIEGKDIERKKQLETSEEIGEKIHRKFLKDDNGKIDQMSLSVNIEKVVRGNGESASTCLDRSMATELNNSTNDGVIQSLLSEGLLKPSWKNCINLMTTSGAKGSKVNFQQISAFLGQQELEGKRVPRMVSGKTLPCFPPWDYAPRAGGFIIDRFLTGLRPQEYYFHCMAGREGLVDTAVKTSRSGYLQRCLIKNLECLQICYDHTVRDADGSIVQFCYGEDGVDVHQSSFIAKFDALAANQEMLQKKSCRQFEESNNYVVELPSALIKKAEKFVDDYSLKERILSNMVKQEDLLKLMKHKYLSSLAQPGEPVGVLAAQSVGEPSTQMTLNTFHLAGRGEMNVTLGIPRLQEILMTASNDIKTPVMTCPLHEGTSEEDAERFAGRLKKITLADLLESIEVSVVPLNVKNHQICSIYKLKMKLCEPELFLEDSDISLEDCEATLEVVFVRELEDAIQNHLLLLSKISGIKNFIPDSRSKASNETDEVASGRSQGGKENDDDDDDDDDDDGDGELAEDLGLDAQKRKQQAIDEMDYEDGSEEELDEGEPLAGSERDIDQSENEDAIIKDDVTGVSDTEDAASEMLSGLGSPLKPKSSDKKDKSVAKRKKSVRAKVSRKETDRAIHVAAKGLHFEVHFKFVNEPHILLAQVAMRTAKKVSVKSSGKIGQCRQITCKENQVIYFGKDPNKREDILHEKKKDIMALQTEGVDFNAFWQLQDQLQVRYIYSNHVQAMLNTYGVEAARETIIREIKHVFNSYGISVNIRHLTLIADFMTHSGGYRPMSRLGGIAESISPFSKMTFETAAKFIVQAACHGEMDNLESPSARICLGLPVKVGTGCFDLMQKVDI